jgi:dGTPase
VKLMLDRWVGDVIANTGEQIKAAGVHHLEDVRAWPQRLVSLGEVAEQERKATKEFLYRKLYFSPALDAEKDNAERVITELFEAWMGNPETLPQSYREQAEHEPLARIVCDYIAGMTDHYILEQYEKFVKDGRSTKKKAIKRGSA